MMPQLLGDLKASGILLATKSQVFLMQWPWFFLNWGKYAKVQIEAKTNFSYPSLGRVLNPVWACLWSILEKNMSRNLRAEKEGLEAYSACHPKAYHTSLPVFITLWLAEGLPLSCSLRRGLHTSQARAIQHRLASPLLLTQRQLRVWSSS